jgi:hypothetical protein
MRDSGPRTSGAVADAASMPHRFAVLALLAVLAVLAAAFYIALMLASPAQASKAAGEARQAAWVAEASAGLEQPVIDALQSIVGIDRRLLALRSYLRAGDALSARWSWSQERLSIYPSTPEGKAAAVDIDAVAAAFTAANPDFSLHVNRQVRSLEVQIAHWNENASVGAAAAALVAHLERRFSDHHAPLNGDELRRVLIDWRPNSAAALAAPGLSAHGQGRAYDFQVEHDGQIIAGANAATAHRRWDAAGWTLKLHAAVNAAGNHFVGPIQSPYEPWHYAYTPVP